MLSWCGVLCCSMLHTEEIITINDVCGVQLGIANGVAHINEANLH